MKQMKQYQCVQLKMKKTIQSTIYRKIVSFNPELQELIDENEIDQVNPQFLELVGGKEDVIIMNYLQQRHSELLSIKQSIQEVNEMFLSFAILLDMQKQVINSIEDHCNEIKDYVIETNTNLDTIYELRKKYLTVCFYFIIFKEYFDLLMKEFKY